MIDKYSNQQNTVDTNSSPFFIVGCVRSGTTLLREILNTHPNLVSPEETHFYRWSHPFGTREYMRNLCNNPTLKKHRGMDGIDEELFENMINKSVSRRDLFLKYMDTFRAIRKPTAHRWFDKTPQNVYGVLMMHNDFPLSKFIHIVRHPYNVTASLRLGKVMRIPELIGACNYWTEAVSIANQLKDLNPSIFHEIRYEDLVQRPKLVIEDLLDFLTEDHKQLSFNWKHVHKELNQHQKILKDVDRCLIDDVCGHWIRHYDYVMVNKAISHE